MENGDKPVSKSQSHLLVWSLPNHGEVRNTWDEISPPPTSSLWIPLPPIQPIIVILRRNSTNTTHFTPPLKAPTSQISSFCKILPALPLLNFQPLLLNFLLYFRLDYSGSRLISKLTTPPSYQYDVAGGYKSVIFFALLSTDCCICYAYVYFYFYLRYIYIFRGKI